jgi:hypothetical protein
MEKIVYRIVKERQLEAIPRTEKIPRLLKVRIGQPPAMLETGHRKSAGKCKIEGTAFSPFGGYTDGSSVDFQDTPAGSQAYACSGDTVMGMQSFHKSKHLIGQLLIFMTGSASDRYLMAFPKRFWNRRAS